MGFEGATITKEEQNEIRLYLLGQLEEAAEERLELRLLTDPAFVEEFDTVVDEITDEYVGNELEAYERQRAEQYFLRSSRRQQKVQFVDELRRRAAAERGQPSVAAPASVGFFERLSLFWTSQPVSIRTAATVVTIVIVMGLAFLMWPRNPGSGTYASVSLPISTSDRAEGTETTTVRLDPGMAGIRIQLELPDQARDAKSHHIELLDEQGRPRNLLPADHTEQSLIVTIPANEITRGAYIIHLHAVNPDGSKSRIRGSYFFNVE